MPFINALLWKMYSRRAYTRSLARAAMTRWANSRVAHPDLPPPLPLEEQFKVFETKLRDGNWRCNNCCCRLSALRRERRHRMPATEQDVIDALHAINVAVNTVNASLEGPLSQLRDAAMQLSGALDNAALLAATDELAHALAGLADALATVANTFRSEGAEASTEVTRSRDCVEAEDEADDSDGSSESGDVAGRHWASENEGEEDGVGGAAESAQPTVQPTAVQPTVQPAASSTSTWPGDEVIGTVGNTKFQERRWTLEPRNATPDCLSPGRDYGPANMQMDCIGSNILKNICHSQSRTSTLIVSQGRGGISTAPASSASPP